MTPTPASSADRPLQVQPSTATRIAQRKLASEVMKLLMANSQVTQYPAAATELRAKIRGLYEQHLEQHCPHFSGDLLAFDLALGEAGVELRPRNLATGLWFQGQYDVPLTELRGEPDGPQWYANRLVFFSYSKEEGMKVVPRSRMDLMSGPA